MLVSVAEVIIVVCVPHLIFANYRSWPARIRKHYLVARSETLRIFRTVPVQLHSPYHYLRVFIGQTNESTSRKIQHWWRKMYFWRKKDTIERWKLKRKKPIKDPVEIWNDFENRGDWCKVRPNWHESNNEWKFISCVKYRPGELDI